MERIKKALFEQDVLELAPRLIGKLIVRKYDDGVIEKFRITETEAYRGEEDLACHASKGRTPRTEVMYHQGGNVYVYLIYGKYWMLNFVTNATDYPAAVLIRGVEEVSGPGRLGSRLKLDKTFYGEDLENSSRIWLEDDGCRPSYSRFRRIGVDYAGEWAKKDWRFVVKPRSLTFVPF
ncbi:MAG: DNA-3-methyladenine glycosylase [Prolixibacteraceae bacterium]